MEQVTKEKNINGNAFGVKKEKKKVYLCKVDFWSTVDLGQMLTSVNGWPWSMLTFFENFLEKRGKRKRWLGQNLGYDKMIFI